MTGYGQHDGEVAGRRLTVELKTVNHRFLNFFSKLPFELQRFEPEILNLVKARLQRGQVNVFASWNGGDGELAVVSVNPKAARQAAESLRRAAQAAGVPADVTLEHLLAIPAVTSPEEIGLEPEELWRQSETVFAAALEDLNSLREREGADLETDLRSRLTTITGLVDQIEARRPAILEDCRNRLTRRVEEVTRDLPAEVAVERVAMEVAVFADRSDVAEELVRLRSHVRGFEELMTSGGVVGRKLEFLLQEMNRETNTVGSKASDAVVSRLVVEVKAELEKIREQVQNVE
jgi:uncharacterized protein (TIGR00255 family)